MKIHATLLLAAAAVFGPQSAGAITLGLSGNLTSLDSSVCIGASPDCTETTADIAPIAFSYSRSFASAFDVFGSYVTPLGDGRTAYQAGSGQGSNPAMGFDHAPLLAFLPAVNVTAEQFAAGTNSTLNDALIVGAGKLVITQADGEIVQSSVSGDLFESQQWATTLPSGAWMSTQYAVDFILFYDRVPMTIADTANPMDFGTFQANLERQLLSGGDIPVFVTYILDDGVNSIEQVDTWSGVAHLTSLDGIAPVPEAPASLAMLAGLLVIGVQRIRTSPGRSM